jgi:hypothetical protein
MLGLPIPRRSIAAGVLLGLVWLSGCAPRVTPIAPPPGGYRQSYTSRISGQDVAEFIFPGEAGQDIALVLMGDGGVQFDLYPPGGGATLFSSTVREREVATTLDRDGAYTVQVYLVGPRISSTASANFALDIVVTEPEEPAA